MSDDKHRYPIVWDFGIAVLSTVTYLIFESNGYDYEIYTVIGIWTAFFSRIMLYFFQRRLYESKILIYGVPIGIVLSGVILYYLDLLFDIDRSGRMILLGIFTFYCGLVLEELGKK